MSSAIVNAADLTVQEFGAGGNYSSINAAMTAAVNGDRIIVIPKAGNAPWVEDLNVKKSLTFISDNENGKIKLTGHIYVHPNSALNVTFIGLDISGFLRASQQGNGGTRTIVNIYNCTINGDINFNKENYYVSIASSSLKYIEFRAGRILGSTIYGYVLIKPEGQSSYPVISDSMLIIGNRILNSFVQYPTISINASKYSFVINNNFITTHSTGIELLNLKPSDHEVINNTFYLNPTSANKIAIEIINLPQSSKLQIKNNLLHSTSSNFHLEHALYGGASISGLVTIGFNYFNDGFDYYFFGLTNDGTNVTGFPFTLNTTTGAVLTGNLTDVGHPDATFTDLDLTTNDVGCYGGSFSMDNFFPANDTNAKVYYLELPRRTGAGITTVPVKAEAFDK